jgi:hypothetical protein
MKLSRPDTGPPDHPTTLYTYIQGVVKWSGERPGVTVVRWRSGGGQVVRWRRQRVSNSASSARSGTRISFGQTGVDRPQPRGISSQLMCGVLRGRAARQAATWRRTVVDRKRGQVSCSKRQYDLTATASPAKPQFRELTCLDAALLRRR